MQTAPTPTRPLTAHERELLAAPTIASQFPVSFNKRQRWTELEGLCSHCEKTIPDLYLRGHVSRPIATAAVIDSIGFCPSCKQLSLFYCRLHADMSLTAINQEGRWARWRAKPSWIERLRGLFQRNN